MNIIVTGSIAYDYLMSFPGQLHRAPAARPPAAGEPQLPRGLDGQAARRLCAEHRLHAGAARRAAAADGDGRAGLRRVPAAGSRRRASTRRSSSRSPGKFTASFFCSTDQRRQPDRVVLHRRDGARGRAVVPRRRAAATWRSSRRTTRRRWCSTRAECRDARHPVHLRSRASRWRGWAATSCKARRRRRAHRHLQRLRVRDHPREDRAGRGGDAASTPTRRRRHEGREGRVDHPAATGTHRRARRAAASRSSIRPASATRSAAGS